MQNLNGGISLRSGGSSVVLYNPMTGVFGKGIMNSSDDESEVYVQLEKKESIIVQYFEDDLALNRYPYYSIVEKLVLSAEYGMYSL